MLIRLFTCLLLITSLQLPAQTLEDVVTSGAESKAEGPNGGKIIWTLGELMVEYYPNGNAIDQGFLQLRFIISPVEEAPEHAPGWLLRAWPNPTGNGWINVSGPAGLQFVLFNTLGQPLLHTTSGDEIIALDFTTQPAGQYWLRATDKQGNTRAVQIQKL